MKCKITNSGEERGRGGGGGGGKCKKSGGQKSVKEG